MNYIEPSQTIFHIIEKAIKDYRKFAQKNISEFSPSITVDQLLVLQFLNSDPLLTQKEISELTFKDKASMTRMINSMKKKEIL